MDKLSLFQGINTLELDALTKKTTRLANGHYGDLTANQCDRLRNLAEQMLSLTDRNFEEADQESGDSTDPLLVIGAEIDNVTTQVDMLIAELQLGVKPHRAAA